MQITTKLSGHKRDGTPGAKPHDPNPKEKRRQQRRQDKVTVRNLLKRFQQENDNV